MTKIAERIRSGEIAAPDVLVGGTPCQAFSVAGARKGLADDRGQLTISYGELADAIDDTRTAAGRQPAIIVWENVPGVLSSKDNAFGAFLGLLAGEDCELQPPGKKWTNAGFVSGPKRTIAWRVIDAQYFGVAQRRRRVFVVASARADFDPRKVLFESEGVRRDTPPSREAGQIVAALTANGVGTCGADDNQGQAGHLIPQRAFRMTAFGEYADDESASTCKARDYKDATDLAVCVTGNMTHTLKAEGFDGSEDGTGRGTPIVNTFSSTGQGAWAEGCGTLRAREQESHEHLAVMTVHGTQDPDTNVELAHTLGRNQGQENAVFAFNSKDHGQDAAEEISPTLRSAGHADSHANAGAPPAVAYGFQPRIARNGRGDMGDIVHSLNAQSGETGKGDAAPCVALNMAVRRLTPVECERLQGFPDNHTLIPIAKLNKLIADELEYLRTHFPDMPEEEAHRLSADGPRYKAIGNSMAVPCMAWIGKRILQQLEGAM
jgi:site-specific DNA-cytosine methylase